MQCPYRYYRELRARAPVHRLPSGEYLVSRWADIVHVSRHPELYSCFLGVVDEGWEKAFGSETGEEDGKELFTPWPTPFTDPPEHKLKRSLMQLVVGRDRMRRYEPLIRELADGLIDRFAARGAVEFKSEFAEEL